MNFYTDHRCAGERETVNCPFNKPKVKHRKEWTMAPTGKVTPNWWKVKLDLKVCGLRLCVLTLSNTPRENLQAHTCGMKKQNKNKNRKTIKTCTNEIGGVSFQKAAFILTGIFSVCLFFFILQNTEYRKMNGAKKLKTWHVIYGEKNQTNVSFWNETPPLYNRIPWDTYGRP